MKIEYHEKMVQGQGNTLSVTPCPYFGNRHVGDTSCAAICLHRRSIDRDKKIVDCGHEENYIYRKA